jgi:Ras-specific guanine nucleotide-releasing factor 1/Ras-specific guanine nucleotide-releasing factor 2
VLRKETKRSSFSVPPSGRGSFSAGATNEQQHQQQQQQQQHPETTGFTDTANLSSLCESVQDSIELRKIKKVQSFFRGWFVEKNNLSI